MDVVENGDMETAQRIGDEAARAAMPKTKILNFAKTADGTILYATKGIIKKSEASQ